MNSEGYHTRTSFVPREQWSKHTWMVYGDNAEPGLWYLWQSLTVTVSLYRKTHIYTLIYNIVMRNFQGQPSVYRSLQINIQHADIHRFAGNPIFSTYELVCISRDHVIMTNYIFRDNFDWNNQLRHSLSCVQIHSPLVFIHATVAPFLSSEQCPSYCLSIPPALCPLSLSLGNWQNRNAGSL